MSILLAVHRLIIHVSHCFYSFPITVPTGLAEFPHEVSLYPEPWLHSRFLDLVQFSEMPRGGHFAAFEEPELFADDIIMFVGKVEKRIAANRAEETTESES